MSRILNNINPAALEINKQIEKKKIKEEKLPEKSFGEVLKEKQKEIKISKHAAKRIQGREIKVSKEDVEKIKAGIDKIDKKGGRESVIFLKDNAYVVNIPNRTVVTVVDKENLKENVFTNIDSVLIL